MVESDKDLVLRIWPAIVYQATGQLCRSILEHLDTDYNGRGRQTIKYRRLFLLATLTICGSLMVAGIFFSSAWVRISTTTQTIAIVFYGFFASIGSSLFIWKTHVILEAVRPREDIFVRKTIHLCGEAFCQLFLSFAFTNLRTLYGTAQSIVLMSALLVNLIPISLIITKHRNGSIRQRISMLKTDATFPTLQHQLGRYSSNNVALVDQLDGIEMRTWKNPLLEHHYHHHFIGQHHALLANTNYPTSGNVGIDGPTYQILPQNDLNMLTLVNPNGVEIMDIIPEEDETVSVIRSSTATIDNYSRMSKSTSQSIHQKSISNGLQVSKEVMKQAGFKNLVNLLRILLDSSNIYLYPYS